MRPSAGRGWCVVASDAERSRAYRDRKRGTPPRTPAPCGTTAAYARHIRNGEEPCEACREANAQRHRDLYRRRKG